MWNLSSSTRDQLVPLQWKCGVLTSGLPGNSPVFISNSFLVTSLGFSIYKIMLSTNSDEFTSSFQFGCLLLPFPAWVLWPGFPILCGIRMARVGIFVLPRFYRDRFKLFTIKYDINWRSVSYMAFIMLTYIPVKRTVLRVFIINEC